MRFNLNISDEDRKTILENHNKIKEKSVLKEQDESVNYKMAIQCFLNKKGITDDSGDKLKVDGFAGDKTEEAISKYQSKIHVYPSDGVFGPNTSKKMPPKDKEILKQCISDHGDFIDKLTRFFGLD